MVKLTIINPMKMELDMGTSMSIFSEKTWQLKLHKMKLSHSPMRLRTLIKLSNSLSPGRSVGWHHLPKPQAKLRLVIVTGNGLSFSKDLLACLASHAPCAKYNEHARAYTRVCSRVTWELSNCLKKKFYLSRTLSQNFSKHDVCHSLLETLLAQS